MLDRKYMDSNDQAIIAHAVRALIKLMTDGTHIEASFDITGKKYELTLNEVE